MFLFFSCVYYVFVRVCLYVLCGHLLWGGWPLGSRLWCLLWVCHFPIGILGQVWYLIVSISDLCTLTYFEERGTHLFRQHQQSQHHWWSIQLCLHPRRCVGTTRHWTKPNTQRTTHKGQHQMSSEASKRPQAPQSDWTWQHSWKFAEISRRRISSWPGPPLSDLNWQWENPTGLEISPGHSSLQEGRTIVTIKLHANLAHVYCV